MASTSAGPKIAKGRKSNKADETSGVKFVEGCIVRVKLENFVTYDSVEFKPGPHLNVIIGPNGTGKSTIVCAICLGLGGKTSLLGRAHQPMEFIKHGTQKALVEIELFNPAGDNWVIRREINKNNQSQWSVNGRPATQKAVEETVTRLNIQVGNLCQFLPQDKVADFAKMSQQELLENTEKAVGTQDMFDNHCRLKRAREEGRTLEQTYANTRERLERETQKNARLEQDVKNYEERQHHLEKIKILQMKRPWVEYEEKRCLYQAEKERKEKLSDVVKKVRAENMPMKNKLDKARQKQQVVEVEMKKKAEQVKDHANKAAARSKEIEDQTDKMAEIEDDLKGKRGEEAKRKKKIGELQKHLESLQSELANLDDSTDVQPLIEKCTVETRKTNQEMTRIQSQGDTVRGQVQQLRRQITNLQGELKRVQDVANQRMDMLRKKHKHTYDAVLWLRANQHRFKGTIYEPLMLILNVKQPQHAKYVESHIAYKDLIAFVCENQDDADLFLKIMRDEQNLRVNAVRVPDQPLSSFKASKPIEHYKSAGFFSYLMNLFECPEAVMCYLCANYRVFQIPVGNKYTKDHVEQVISNFPELRNFYTADHQYTIKKSKYSNQMSSRCTELGKPQSLTVTLDVQRKLGIEHNLRESQQNLADSEQEYLAMQQSYKGLETKMNTLRAEKKSLMEKKDLRRSLEQKIHLKQQSIQRLEGEAINLNHEEARAAQKIKQFTVKKAKLLSELKNHTQLCLHLGMEKVRLSLSHSMAIRDASLLENELREQSHALQGMEAELEELKDRVKEIKDTARRLLETAKKATNTQRDEELSLETKRAFETCPASLEEIDSAIHEEQARADCVFNTDESVVAEYQRRKKDIARLEVEVVRRQEGVDKHQDEITQIKSQWFQPLQELVDRINENFGSFFRGMKCAGEVDLNIPDNPEDYEKYGIRIKVKYRDSEQLRELTPHHQSGGERSVATVLYMMALQELTKCPFRCVDEINQGMDPQNERKVFELVVRTACAENTSQYFLLTPKLLPDLEYGARMTVLCVYNGSHMIDHREWNIKKFMKRRARME